MRSGIHQLQCHTCHLCHIGQTGQNVENISDILSPITPIQHMQFTFSTTDMNMDPRTSTCSYSTQSTKVDEWTQLFHNIKPSSMNSPRKMKTPLWSHLWHTTQARMLMTHIYSLLFDIITVQPTDNMSSSYLVCNILTTIFTYLL